MYPRGGCAWWGIGALIGMFVVAPTMIYFMNTTPIKGQRAYTNVARWSAKPVYIPIGVGRQTKFPKCVKRGVFLLGELNPNDPTRRSITPLAHARTNRLIGKDGVYSFDFAQDQIVLEGADTMYVSDVAVTQVPVKGQYAILTPLPGRVIVVKLDGEGYQLQSWQTNEVKSRKLIWENVRNGFGLPKSGQWYKISLRRTFSPGEVHAIALIYGDLIWKELVINFEDVDGVVQEGLWALYGIDARVIYAVVSVSQ